MAAPHNTKVFATEDCKVAKVTADVSTAPTYGTEIDVPGIKKVGIAFDFKNVELRGDNKRLDSDTTLVGVTVTFDHAKLSFDALPVFIGGTSADSGTGTAEKVTYSRIGTDQIDYFGLSAKTPASGYEAVGGDLHLVLPKLKITSYALGTAEEDYQIFSGEASGVFTIANDLLIRLIGNETAEDVDLAANAA